MFYIISGGDNLKKQKLVLRGLFVSILTFALMGPMTALADPAATTVDGVGNYYVTGDAYPSSIAITGYNSRETNLYTNITFTTTETIGPTQTPTFHYYISIYDGNGDILGSYGSEASPIAAIGNEGQASKTVTNLMVSLTDDLTAQFRVVVIVTSIDITP